MNGESEELNAENAMTQIIPIRRDKQLYFVVNLNGILVGEEVLKHRFSLLNKISPFFFDSGSNFTFFESDLYDKLVGLIRKQQKRQILFGNCFIKNGEESSEEVFQNFPLLHLDLEEAIYTWFPRDYFYEAEDKFCLAFDEGIQNILGSSFMRNYNLFFD